MTRKYVLTDFNINQRCKKLLKNVDKIVNKYEYVIQFISEVSDSEQTKRAVLNKQELL